MHSFLLDRHLIIREKYSSMFLRRGTRVKTFGRSALNSIPFSGAQNQRESKNPSQANFCLKDLPFVTQGELSVNFKSMSGETSLRDSPFKGLLSIQ